MSFSLGFNRQTARSFGLLFSVANLAGTALAATPPTVVLANFDSGISGVSAVTAANSPAGAASNSVVSHVTESGSGRLRITDSDGGANGAVAVFTGTVTAPGYYLFTADVKVDNASAAIGSFGMAVNVGGATTTKISDANAGYVRNLSGTGDAAKGYQTIGAAVNVPAGGTFPRNVAIYFSSDPSGNSYNAPSTDGNFVNAHRTNATAWASGNTNAVYIDNIKQIGPGNFGEERHLWISIGDGYTNLSTLESRLVQAKANGFNCIDILARYRANAYYVPNRDDNTYPNPEPMAAGVSRTNDPLQYAIDRCRQLGMKIYISFSVFAVSESSTYPSFMPSGSIMGFYNGGTPRAMTLADGGEGLWADPGRADVRNYTRNVVMDIITNYDVDGVIFDRIRYPNQNFGYNSVALSEMGYSTVPAPSNAAWREARREAVTHFLQSAYESITTKKPWVVVGATPIAYGSGLTDTYNSVLQGWNNWNSRKTANRNVDFGCLDLWQPQFYRLSSTPAPHTAPAANDTLMKKMRFGDLSVLSSDYGTAPGSNAFVAPLFYHPSAGDSANSAANAQNASDTRYNGMNGFGFFAATTTLADISMIRNPANTTEGTDVLGGTPSFNDYLFKKGYDKTPPNAVTGASASLTARGNALIKWNVPPAAVDGDSPVAYLVYASSTSSVAETYANLLTKKPITTNWYIPTSGIAGSYYYKIVSLDDYNNKGTAVTVGPVTVTGVTAPPADIIVDNPSATVTGAWTTATSATDKYGSNYLNRGSGTGANKVAFSASIPRTGVWDVAEWHPAGSNRATNARHIITNAGATQTVTANQTVNGGKWNTLGSYNFNASSSYSVTIDDIFTGSVVMADAIRWSYNLGASNPTPAAPTALAATVTAASEVVLTWNDNATNETGYEVVRWREGIHPTIIQLPANSTGYADISVADAKTYKYLVRAYTATTQSGDSNTITVTVPAYAPPEIIIDDTVATFNISWSSGTHSTDYGAGYKFASKNNGRTATFGFTPTKDGVYEVYEWHVASTNRAADAPHTVNHAGGSAAVTVNQQANGGKWNSIGQYQFLNGVNYGVVISDNFTVGDVIMADAIRVVYVSKIPVTVADIIIDNTAAAVTGSWTAASSATDKYGSDYLFRGSSATGENKVTYNFTLPHEGVYEIFEWHCQGTNRTNAARHTVNHRLGSSLTTVNQTANGGAWNSLGSYQFNDGVPYSVVIDDLFSNGSVVIADGIKIVYLGELP